MKPGELYIGIVGAGGFACFAAEAFSSTAGVKISAVHDVNEKAAAQLATNFGASVFHSYSELLQSENIDLIYIATPPFLHYSQSRQALLAGKHVICEKPAALNAADAAALQALAESSHLLYVVNLMQRYNPLYTTVKQIVDQKILGAFLHGYFENYASDENLKPDHWFWDETKSGGIFIEHAVHFFDMFAGWFGMGDVVHALQVQRPHLQKKLVDRVQATVLYGDAIVNFYHGFDQPKILDRQELRLEFEKGDVTLYEWVPVKMQLHGLLETKNLEALKASLNNPVVQVLNATTSMNSATGRFQAIQYGAHVRIESGSSAEKEARYKELLVAMLLDQWAWIKDRTHKRVIDSSNAVESVRMAECATKMSNYINTQTFSNTHIS